MKKLTDNQKSRRFKQRQDENFQASNRLEGFVTQRVDLAVEDLPRRIAELRGHYER